jgi:hypothetical protein
MFTLIIDILLVILIIVEVRKSKETIRVYKRKVQDGITLAIVTGKKNDAHFKSMFEATAKVFSIISDDMKELRDQIEALQPKKKVKVAKIIKKSKSKKVVKKSK